VALGELFAIGAEHGRQVREDGGGPVESFVEKQVQRRGGEPFIGTEHVADAHGVVVDDAGEVIGREVVALEENGVAEDDFFPGDVAFDGVVERDGAIFRDDEAHDVRDIGGYVARTAVAGVTDGLFVGGLGVALGGEAFGGAVAAIGVAAGDQAFGNLFVHGQTEALYVRTRGAADAGARGRFGVRLGDFLKRGSFIEVEADPAEVLDEGADGAGDEAFAIGVFDAEKGLAAVVVGHKDFEKRGADAADVEHARGTGGEASSDF